MRVNVNKFEKVKIVYTQDQLDFVVDFIMKKYTTNKVGYTINVVSDTKRTSVIYVRKDKFDEFRFVCKYTNIEIRKEFEVR